MKTDYTLAELQAGIRSEDITWGQRDQMPQGFEFPALCRMAQQMRALYPDRDAFARHFPKGFVVKMTGTSYGSLTILAQ